jgi:4-amino-4-deoxy-L-arabinose transferase-like glycosyltransferase
MLLLILLIAAGLRFWQLGDIPSGLYRDEAANGLDAASVLAGQRQDESLFYFEANNGREPVYIYLTTLVVGLLGQTVLAVRLAAAVVGTLTTWLTYKLASSWFDRSTGLLSAWLWAVTVWPIHLSRTGFRAILLPFFMALTFWIVTLAYKRGGQDLRSKWLWLLAGIIYGAGFYTYLAFWFSLVLFAAVVVYMAITGRGKSLWHGLVWFTVGALIIMSPFILLAWRQPDLILGRMGQVSVFRTVLEEGPPFSILWRHILRAFGLFFIEGDTILRHNPEGRPLFDLLMLVPFLVGLFWCLRNWRYPPAMTLMLWIVIMLGPTILAEDAPHFLRAVGILPAAVMLPALGLSQIWTWTKLPSLLSKALVVLLLFASLIISIKDYYIDYARRPLTAYWFEAAARELADNINAEPPGRSVYLDRRLWDSWPSIRYLASEDRPIALYRPQDFSPAETEPPATIYAWPYEGLEEVVTGISTPAIVSSEIGGLAQGDLEPEPYPLYIRYVSDIVGEQRTGPILANFDNTIQLRKVEVKPIDQRQIQVDLYWSADRDVDMPIVTFVHVEDATSLIGQSDSVPSQANWPSKWWKPGLLIHDQHLLQLNGAFDEDHHHILVGIYRSDTEERLPIRDLDGTYVGDSWLIMGS